MIRYSISMKCDNILCTKEEVIFISSTKPIEFPSSLDKLPGDWRTVEVDYGNQGGKAKGQVCSFECAVAWQRRQLEATIHNAEHMGLYLERG